jgi:hypothetical protein
MPESQNFTAVVEIEREPGGDVSAPLIAAAYRASRSRCVLLVLHAVSRHEVDRILDAEVTSNALDVAGVRYADIDDDIVMSAVQHVSLIFARSRSFRAKLEQLGVVYRDLGDAERALPRIALQTA